MGISIVRQESETPNILNVDDIIPMRYAYGNQDGYIVGIGKELDATYENGTFTVNSGRAVLQGVEVTINGNGASTTLDTGTDTRYFKIYLEVNLNNNIAELGSYYSTSSYDDVPDPVSGELISGDTAYLLLYTIKLNGSVQAEISKVIKQIYYNHRRLIWSGNAEIGTTNTYKMESFATIPSQNNTMYEIHGEITHSSPKYRKKTFVIYLQIGAHNELGYSTEKIVGTEITSNLMQFEKIEIHRSGDFFYGRALLPTLYFPNHDFVYQYITASITKIYEVE